METLPVCIFTRSISDFCSCYCFLYSAKEVEVIKKELDIQESTVFN